MNQDCGMTSLSLRNPETSRTLLGVVLFSWCQERLIRPSFRASELEVVTNLELPGAERQRQAFLDADY
jgi:hypothetical protein